MKIVSNRRSQVLAARIATAMQAPLIDVRWTLFPDGEIYLQAQETADSVAIIGSLLESDDLIELLLLTDVYREADITLVIPYMGYARQDKVFKPGEALSARAIARTLGAGVARIITINLHEETILPYFGVPAKDYTLAQAISEYIKKLPCNNPLILGPDIGAARLSREIAQAGNWESDHLQKNRISGEEVRIEPKSIPVAGRVVVIVDDIISTGGTQATATKMLYDQGATEIYTVCVHGVLASGAYSRLISAGIKIVCCSDTIEQACSEYSAARTIADAIRR
ncbi:MAG TPA: ribose-phosphate diphosphokinase [Methanospirillum sp.]|nr:ribose-phosphate diphosphokinase [Methanospirillum sp.]